MKRRRQRVQFTREVAGWYDLYRRTFYNYKSDARIASSILEYYMPETNRILEIGIGTGSFAIEMAKLGYVVDGVDNSPAMRHIARKKIEENGFKEFINLGSERCETMDLTQEKKFSSPYSAIISHGLFYFIDSIRGDPYLDFTSYVVGRDNINKAFRKISDHLTQDGLLLLNMINDYNPLRGKRDFLDLGEGGIWEVKTDPKKYDENGEGGELINTYENKRNGDTFEYKFIKSLFRKEDIDHDLVETGFEFVEERLDSAGKRGFYVVRKKMKSA